MIKGKDRKEQKLFFKSLEAPLVINHPVVVLDNLSVEIDSLHDAFQDAELPLAIRGSWVEHDLSFIAVFEEASTGREVAPLLRLQFSPLSEIKAQVLASTPKAVATKLYHHLDKNQCANRLVADIRDHILKATPSGLKEAVEAVFVGLSPDDQDFKDYRVLQGTLTDKYFIEAKPTSGQSKEEKAVIAKQMSQQAYDLALHYQ
jgi:hypothetical protein